jgi:hypothetical protein
MKRYRNLLKLLLGISEPPQPVEYRIRSARGEANRESGGILAPMDQACGVSMSRRGPRY